MVKPDAVEVTKQTQPVQHDADYIKLRLDTQKLHQDILNFLQGTTTTLNFDEKTQTYYEEQKQTGVPLANPKGIQALLSFVVAIINPHTIQGNTERDELYNILKNMERGLSQRLTLNYEDWGIDPNNRDHMIDTIMFMIQMILSRTVDNKERQSYSPSIEKTSNLYTGKKATKVI